MTASSSLDIPFNLPSIGQLESDLVKEALKEAHLSGDGRFTRSASAAVSRLVGGGTTLLTTSCTHALEMSALLMDLKHGDEVIVPSFTFVSTANAFVLRGAVPVFVDIRGDTLNVDEEQIEAAITSSTRGIVIVHYAGVGAEMTRIMEIAEANGLWVIEDNAHGLGGSYRGGPLGSFGALATQSFHATKNVTMGEGGALVVNDPSLLKRAEVIREKGTNRSQFLRGTIDRYTWVDIGSSYLPSEVLSALLQAQLDRFEEIQVRRREIWDFYSASLTAWANNGGVQLPTVPAHVVHAAHLFHVLTPAPAHQGRLIEHLRARGIGAASHYRPLHNSPFGSDAGRLGADCPVTERVADTIVRLPLYPGLSSSDIGRIASVILEFEV